MNGTLQEQPVSVWHAHPDPRCRAKEEVSLPAAPAALAASRRPEEARCVVRVVTARGGRGVFFRVAGGRAIRLRLAWGRPPMLVRFEADLRYKGCIRGQLVVAEEVRDLQLRRHLTLDLAPRVGHGLEGEVRAVVRVL